MSQIRTGHIKMRPRLYFIGGSILTFIGLVATSVVSIFFVGLIRFSLRAHGPMASIRLEQILSSFPWWLPVVAVAGLVIGVKLLRAYDFSYKVNPWILVAVFVALVVLSGWLFDALGFNDVLMRRGFMRRMVPPPVLMR